MILKTSVKTGRQCFLSEFKATCGKNARKWCKWQQGQAPLEMATACLRCFLNFQGQTSWHQVTQSYLRCIRGTTQNPNECINSMVWVRCLKHKHHGTKFVVYPAALAVCHFHKGAEYRKDIMNELSIHSETPTSHAFRLRDNNRLLKADTQAMAMEKKSHKAVQLVCTWREEALQCYCY